VPNKLLTENNQLELEFDQVHYDNLKAPFIREIHKVLSKWNKPTVKQFLKSSNLFENLDKTTVFTPNDFQIRPANGVIKRVAETGPENGFITPMSVNANQTNTGGSITPNIKTLDSLLNPPAAVQSAPSARDLVKQEREKEILKLSKYENSEEIHLMFLNLNKVNDQYKKNFKISIENTPGFYKQYDEIPVLSMPLLDNSEEHPYEQKGYFGDFNQTQIVETGLVGVIEEIMSRIREYFQDDY
jgi:hypothetical protein